MIAENVKAAVQALLPKKAKKSKTELELRLEAEAGRNRHLAKLCPGYYGVGFLFPDISRGVGGTPRTVYRNEDVEVVMWDAVPLDHRRYSGGRVSKLLCVTKPHFRYGVPTIEAGEGSTVTEFTSRREAMAEDYGRYWRMGVALQETCQSAGRTHAKSLQRRLEGRKDLPENSRKVRYGGEWHDSMPYAEDCFPEALISTSLTLAELRELCGQLPGFGCKVGKFMRDRKFVTPLSGTYVGDEAVVMRQHETDVRALKRGLKGLAHKEVVGHYIRDVHGRTHEFLIPASAEIRFQPGEAVSLGDTFGWLPEPPTVGPATKKGVGKAHREEPLEARLYDKARRNIPAPIMDAVEALMLQCDLQYLHYTDEAEQVVHVSVLPWDKYQDVITAHPDKFSLFGWDMYTSIAFYDDGCEGVGLAVHRPYFPRPEDAVRGMRIVLPAAKDPLVSPTKLVARKDQAKPVMRVKARSRKEQAKPGVDATAATHHLHFLRLMNVQAEIIEEEKRRLFVESNQVMTVVKAPVEVKTVVVSDAKPAISQSLVTSKKPAVAPVSAGQKLLKLLRR